MSHLSPYAQSLNAAERDRYIRKLNICIDGNEIALPDPYNVTTGWFADPSKLPPTQYKSIYNYLINTPGPYTGEALEAFKSLEV